MPWLFTISEGDIMPYYIEAVQPFKQNELIEGPFDEKEEAEKWGDKNLPKSWRKLDFVVNYVDHTHETRFGTLVPWGGSYVEEKDEESQE